MPACAILLSVCSLCLVCVIFHMKLHSYLAEGRTGCNMYVVEIFHVNDLLRNIPAHSTHSSPCHVLQICTGSHCNSFLSVTTDLLHFSWWSAGMARSKINNSLASGQYCDGILQIVNNISYSITIVTIITTITTQQNIVLFPPLTSRLQGEFSLLVISSEFCPRGLVRMRRTSPDFNEIMKLETFTAQPPVVNAEPGR